MTARRVEFERIRVTSRKAFRDVVAAFEAAIGHPDIRAFVQSVAAASTSSRSKESPRKRPARRS